MALDSGAAVVEEEVEQEFEIAVESTEDGELDPQIIMEEALVEDSPEEDEESKPALHKKQGLPIKITVTVE